MSQTSPPATYLRSEGVLHSETLPAVSTADGLKQWYFKGRLHRADGPAVETASGPGHHFWRGVLITKKIAHGEMSAKEIMEIANIEQRRCAMERVGYLNFKNQMKKVHEGGPIVGGKPMYELYQMEIPGDEELKILCMHDPSLDKYYAIRVNPAEKDCLLAVVHSYGFKTWDEYAANCVWA